MMTNVKKKIENLILAIIEQPYSSAYFPIPFPNILKHKHNILYVL